MSLARKIYPNCAYNEQGDYYYDLDNVESMPLYAYIYNVEDNLMMYAGSQHKTNGLIVIGYNINTMKYRLIVVP